MIDGDLAAALALLRERGCVFKPVNTIPIAEARRNLAYEAELTAGPPDLAVSENSFTTEVRGHPMWQSRTQHS